MRLDPRDYEKAVAFKPTLRFRCVFSFWTVWNFLEREGKREFGRFMNWSFRSISFFFPRKRIRHVSKKKLLLLLLLLEEVLKSKFLEKEVEIGKGVWNF